MKIRKVILIPLLTLSLVSCGPTDGPDDLGDEFAYTYDANSETYTFVAYGGEKTSITIPGSYDDGTNGVHPVSTIALECLIGNSTVKNIEVGEGVETISSYAFANSGIETITLPSTLTFIGDEAFKNCTSLKTVTISSDANVTLGVESFANCTSLTSFAHPYNMVDTTIPEGAFSGCSSLKAFTFSPYTLEIEDDAFYGCTSLTTLNNFNNYIADIGERAFYNCSSLAIESLPDGIYTIGDYAFYSCNSLTSVILPDDLRMIGEFSFAMSSNINEVILNANVAYIPSTAFVGLPHLEMFAFADGADNVHYEVVDGVLFNDDVTTLVTYPGGLLDSNYVVPSSVKSIENYAFYEAQLTSVDFSLTTIESLSHSAFAYSKLTSITLPVNVNVHIESYAFYHSSDLVEIINSDSVTYIEAYAFSNCVSFGTATPAVFENIEYVGMSAFSGLSANSEIHFGCPETATSGWDSLYDTNSEAQFVFVNN